MEFTLDLAVDFGHFVAAFDEGLAELFALAPLQPVVQKFCNNSAAIASADDFFEFLKTGGRQDVGSFDQSHSMAPLPDTFTRQSCLQQARFCPPGWSRRTPFEHVAPECRHAVVGLLVSRFQRHIDVAV